MVDLISLDQEKIARVLSKHGVHPQVAELFIELHETQRAMNQLVNELMTHQSGIIAALPMINQLLKGHGEQLKAIDRKFSDNTLDLIKGEKFDG